MTIYLASQSPRRAELLAQIGVAHRLLLPQTQFEKEEAEALEAVLPGEAPRDYVQRVTAGKLDAAVARHARRGLPATPILCSDTTVALGQQILGKQLGLAAVADLAAQQNFDPRPRSGRQEMLETLVSRHCASV